MLNNFTETELKNERWKDIDGYEGMYQVSDLGRVRSKKYGYWRVMRFGKNHKGYLHIGLCRNGKQKKFYVHRLVAQAFIPNDDESKTQINHINEDKTENKVSNLEWCSAQYNVTYNDIHYRRRHPKYKRSKIKEYYRPDLTEQQNLDIFKEQGIECSFCTINRLKKDLDLIGTNRKYVRNKIKDLYDQNLTYQENINLFKEQGIECSDTTVKKLRKELGLTGSRTKPKRRKVEKLYNPNLTYADNLEIFRENGVECSVRVINSIRKDLGLVKSTKKK